MTAKLKHTKKEARHAVRVALVALCDAGDACDDAGLDLKAELTALYEDES